MRIDATEKLVGHPIMAIRNMLRKLVFDRAWVERSLKVSRGDAERVIKDLAEKGLICPSGKFKARNEIVWQTTPEGTRLAGAEDRPPIAKAEAERIMKDFFDRIQKVTRDDSFLVRVGEVTLFGSMLAGAEEVNDIDLIVKLEAKVHFSKPYDQVLRDKLDALARAGKSFATAIEFTRGAQVETMAFLQGASPYVSFHNPNTLALIEKADRQRNIPNPGTPSKVIYKAPARTQKI